MTDQLRAENLLESLQPVLADIAEPWGEYWPFGICTISSLLSAPILRVALDDPDLRVVVGYYKDTNHCWLSTSDEWILDPTYAQFGSCDSWGQVCAPGTTKKYEEISTLSLDEEEKYRRSINPSGSTDISQDFWHRDGWISTILGKVSA